VPSLPSPYNAKEEEKKREKEGGRGGKGFLALWVTKGKNRKKRREKESGKAFTTPRTIRRKKDPEEKRGGGAPHTPQGKKKEGGFEKKKKKRKGSQPPILREKKGSPIYNKSTGEGGREVLISDKSVNYPFRKKGERKKNAECLMRLFLTERRGNWEREKKKKGRTSSF